MSGFLVAPKHDFVNLLGKSDTARGNCSYEGYRGGVRDPRDDFSIDFTADNYNRLATINSRTVSEVTQICAGNPNSGLASCHFVYQFDQAGGQCPQRINRFGPNETFFTNRLSASSSIQERTGVFEFQDLVEGIGGVAVLVVIIMVGIVIAKRAINGVTEETSDDDAIEYYEGADGREYWRVKSRFREW